MPRKFTFKISSILVEKDRLKIGKYLQLNSFTCFFALVFSMEYVSVAVITHVHKHPLL